MAESKPKTSNSTNIMILVVVLLALSLFVSLIGTGQIFTGFAGSYGSWNTSTSSVLIPNAAPTIGTVTLEDYPNDAGNASQITLYSGTTKTVYCNATVTDTNGWTDISVVNVTIYDTTIGASWTQNYTSVYTNLSCAIGTNTSSTAAPVSCNVSMQYNANNNTWACAMYAKDTAGSVANTNSSNVLVLSLTALNVDPLIDFGSISLGGTSSADINHTVFNYGNIQIDLKLNGSDLACPSPSVANISVGNMHYDCVNYNTAYGSMSVLTVTSTDANCGSFDLAKTTNATGTITAREKELPWKIQVPATGVIGTCTGTVWFLGEPG